MPPRTRKTRIYVAGPLNAMAIDYIKNMRSMMIWAERLRREGYAVFVPCLDMLMGLQYNYDYADYFDNSQAWLMAADAVFLCPGYEDSKGTLREIALADSLKIPVYFYHNIDGMLKDLPAIMPVD